MQKNAHLSNLANTDNYLKDDPEQKEDARPLRRDALSHRTTEFDLENLHLDPLVSWRIYVLYKILFTLRSQRTVLLHQPEGQPWPRTVFKTCLPLHLPRHRPAADCSSSNDLCPPHPSLPTYCVYVSVVFHYLNVFVEFSGARDVLSPTMSVYRELLEILSERSFRRQVIFFSAVTGQQLQLEKQVYVYLSSLVSLTVLIMGS
ncbi:hypothetical protein E2C01_054390 [Portunus trituberculatus]|uniref:Uncharacterized protein n=1 Tax=Portunus trituberculatus TaxID=210409 RepID=A0A5B7GTJ7_PORTR|nr:hypothetical protein [Portunus trituberculatus]